jgi:hypothetical protein
MFNLINMSNYMNSNIVGNHDHHMELNNSKAEYASFCLSLTCIMEESDVAWFTEMKKSHICYDV